MSSPQRATPARRSSAAGDPELAAAVAKLPKPTVAAAAVNAARPRPAVRGARADPGRQAAARRHRSVRSRGRASPTTSSRRSASIGRRSIGSSARLGGCSFPTPCSNGSCGRSARPRSTRRRRGCSSGACWPRSSRRRASRSTRVSSLPAKPKRGSPKTEARRDADAAKRRKAEERLAAAEEALATAQANAEQAESDLRRAEKAAATALRKVEQAAADVERARAASRLPRMRSAFLFALVLAVVVPASAEAASAYFETPSRNIACGWYSDGGGSLRCEIGSLLRPLPPRPAGLRRGLGLRHLDGSYRPRTGALRRRHDPAPRKGQDPCVRLELAARRLSLRGLAGGASLRQRLGARLLPQPRALADLLIRRRG